MDKKKQKPDKSSPGAKALVDEIVHGTFMKEGTMVAFPTCFPGVAVPIVADESHITALDVTSDGTIYGGTSGKLTHLFVGMFYGVTGVVFDIGMVEGADHCPAICCGKGKVAACVNGPRGGRVVTSNLQPLPFDLIQEWGFSRRPLEDSGEVVKGEPILHAVADDSRDSLVGTTTHHLFTAKIEGSKIQIVGEVSGRGRIAVGSKGGVFGLDGPDHLWRFDPRSRKTERRAVKLPRGAWDKSPLRWASDNRNGLLYTADAEGELFSFSEDHGFSPPLGETPMTPVGCMAVTLDGRVFGFCGSEVSNLFCYHPGRKEVANLGVAVSVIERRRYGYTFGDAVTGRDGQIFFGEDDDLGHLWLYFPRIQST